jgi:hypothetical protein
VHRTDLTEHRVATYEADERLKWLRHLRVSSTNLDTFGIRSAALEAGLGLSLEPNSEAPRTFAEGLFTTLKDIADSFADVGIFKAAT